MREAAAADLSALLAAVQRTVDQPERLYLVAATSHLAEGWRGRVPRLELAGDGATSLADAVRHAATALGLEVVWESPADIVPLPDGWQERARPATSHVTGSDRLQVLHFDPYSVVLRLVARGDELDYVVSLEYLRCGWVELARLEQLLADVLPRFSNQTLAQDPAEFRRKFRGLKQVYARDTQTANRTTLSSAGAERAWL